MNKYKTPGEVGKLLGCSRQNITERCKRLNDEKLAFKDELGWHISEKGVEYLKEHSKKINEPKNEPRASDEVSNNEIIELYKKIIEDKEKQIEKLEFLYGLRGSTHGAMSRIVREADTSVSSFFSLTLRR